MNIFYGLLFLFLTLSLPAYSETYNPMFKDSMGSSDSIYLNGERHSVQTSKTIFGDDWTVKDSNGKSYRGTVDKTWGGTLRDSEGNTIKVRPSLF